MPIINRGYEIKDGKIVKRPRKLDVSARIRQKRSKKQRVVSKAKAAAARGYRP